MDHNVGVTVYDVNTMDQDVALGIIGSITQADLAPLRDAGRLGSYAVVYRILRTHQSGGYGDQGRHPYSWAIAIYVDEQLYRIFNARGAGREWQNLDRVSDWLRQQGFWHWWTRNDLEAIGSATFEQEPAPLLPPNY
jgi:hypothetical protein